MTNQSWGEEFDSKFSETYSALTTKGWAPTTEDVNWDEIKDFIHKVEQSALQRGRIEAVDYIRKEFQRIHEESADEEGLFAVHRLELAEILKEALTPPEETTE